ncbi:hypothetical protein ACLVWQ_02830 [Streptomyces sp. CWNU-52B]|uniref:hypothetical protein n=1 Tax=unclassified Streptomyces TaxID=2593676 RepID=UPI0039BFDE46
MVGYAFPCTPEYWYGELLPEIPEHVRAGRLMGVGNGGVRLHRLRVHDPGTGFRAAVLAGADGIARHLMPLSTR